MRIWCTAAFLEPEHLLECARICEEVGFHGVMVADHIARPATVASPYPYASDGAPPAGLGAAWPDAWVAIGSMAAVTTSLHFSTNIFIAPARHPILLAKAVATAARLSSGRVALGAGVGWMREEFDAVGQDFRTRGPRFDEMIGMLRALWTGEEVEHHGRFYEHDPLTISPVPAQRIPIYIGGESDAALRRAARADGWIGSLYNDEELTSHLTSLERARAEVGTGAAGGFEVIVTLPGGLYDLDRYCRLEDAGVTGVACAPWLSRRDGAHTSSSTLRPRLEHYAEQVIGRL